MIFQRMLIALVLSCAALAAQAQPLIAIIIDDIGDRYDYGMRAMNLPGALTYSILPHTPYARHFAELAHRQSREVMLHLPMQAERGNRLGPGAITQAMSEEEFRHSVRDNLASIPHVRGINNHMGSLLTRSRMHMNWLMSEIEAHDGLFFVDSVTTLHTVAQYVAQGHQLPTTRRDIFLDSERDIDSIRRQFARLLDVAYQNGHALAIGHPYPVTMQVLSEVLPYLDNFGVQLVSVSKLISSQQQRRPKLWHASLPPSPPAAKN